MADDPQAVRELLHRLRNQLNAIAVTAELMSVAAAAGPLADDARAVSLSAHEAAETATEITRVVRALIG